MVGAADCQRHVEPGQLKDAKALRVVFSIVLLPCRDTDELKMASGK